MTTGEKIAKLRKENNYTQEQLAELLGVSRKSVSKYESGIVYPEMGSVFECLKRVTDSRIFLRQDNPGHILHLKMPFATGFNVNVCIR